MDGGAAAAFPAPPMFLSSNQTANSSDRPAAGLPRVVGTSLRARWRWLRRRSGVGIERRPRGRRGSCALGSISTMVKAQGVGAAARTVEVGEGRVGPAVGVVLGWSICAWHGRAVVQGR